MKPTVAILELLSIDSRLSEQFRIFDIHVLATSHAAKIVHGAVHIWHLLNLLLIWLKLLLIRIVSLVVGRCLELSLDKLLLFYYLLLTFGNAMGIRLNALW